jgi:hypothetical protein
MAAGYHASAATVLLSPTATGVSAATTTPQPSSISTVNQDVLRTHEYTGLCIERLDELIGLLERGFEERDRRLIVDDP